MKKIIFINENYRFIKDNNDIIEGGFSRNYYLMRWIQDNITDLKEIRLTNNRVFNAISVYYHLLKSGSEIILFQYPLLGMPIFKNNYIFRLTNKVLFLSFKYALRKKEIIFDVSDLKYEQSVDLKINTSIISSIKKFEENFFALPAKFVFASSAMRDYARKKYNIPHINTDVCNNGGREIICSSEEFEYIDMKKINFVYAGSLNKGRQIETMIETFPDDDRIQMIIMGSEGEWISNDIVQKNIIYLGALPEEKAHRISSKCDIGLIPYDDTKKYYNIAYPTKLSFYITAGIPFLSTPVEEVVAIGNLYNIGFVETIDDWTTFYMSINKDIISNEKIKIKENKKHFMWEELFESCETYRELTKMVEVKG